MSGFDPLTPGGEESVSDQTNFGVTNRKVYPTAGQGTPYEWNYSAIHVAPAGYKISVTSPDQTLSEKFLHQGNGPCTGCTQGNFGYDNGLAGMPYEERNFDDTGQLVSRKLTSWTLTNLPVWMPANNQAGGYNFSNDATWHPRVNHEESFIYS